METPEHPEPHIEPFTNVVRGEADGPHRCPCCGYVTLAERGMSEICPVCFWEDDGQDDHDADLVRGGPNKRLSLTDARRNFAAFGACDQRCRKFVRDPLPSEQPE
ncbi:CPCC family cysteine-rich protein [Actinocatenispora sera]|uniref:CPCC family cysteine-rich protein n=1 Tax=Actinocatenispora sera TaxID=390989 RepID=UPI0033C25164